MEITIEKVKTILEDLRIKPYLQMRTIDMELIGGFCNKHQIDLTQFNCLNSIVCTERMEKTICGSYYTATGNAAEAMTLENYLLHEKPSIN